MDQMAVENCSIVSAKESLPEFGINDRQARFLPSLILPEIYRTKSGKVVYPAYTQEEKALHWALDRLAGWDLPGKEHVEEYFRYMYPPFDSGRQAVLRLLSNFEYISYACFLGVCLQILGVILMFLIRCGGGILSSFKMFNCSDVSSVACKTRPSFEKNSPR
jgi:hypothetical protein